MSKCYFELGVDVLSWFYQEDKCQSVLDNDYRCRVSLVELLVFVIITLAGCVFLFEPGFAQLAHR